MNAVIGTRIIPVRTEILARPRRSEREKPRSPARLRGLVARPGSGRAPVRRAAARPCDHLALSALPPPHGPAGPDARPAATGSKAEPAPSKGPNRIGQVERPGSRVPDPRSAASVTEADAVSRGAPAISCRSRPGIPHLTYDAGPIALLTLCAPMQARRSTGQAMRRTKRSLAWLERRNYRPALKMRLLRRVADRRRAGEAPPASDDGPPSASVLPFPPRGPAAVTSRIEAEEAPRHLRSDRR
ncbi:hypothetical protein MET9862_04069 [Methylobacterium symbioticum]|uniref:Uncharacterized protein n=1 Tax=Methylobacterium symbioticum TaxID=2584084 RepID=A0A509EJR9_9HYPH|nr:hypothetical protein MET9862_04069 [Methylobacterium symbioticum]